MKNPFATIALSALVGLLAGFALSELIGIVGHFVFDAKVGIRFLPFALAVVGAALGAVIASKRRTGGRGPR